MIAPLRSTEMTQGRIQRVLYHFSQWAQKFKMQPYCCNITSLVTIFIWNSMSPFESVNLQSYYNYLQRTISNQPLSEAPMLFDYSSAWTDVQIASKNEFYIVSRARYEKHSLQLFFYNEKNSKQLWITSNGPPKTLFHLSPLAQLKNTKSLVCSSPDFSCRNKIRNFWSSHTKLQFFPSQIPTPVITKAFLRRRSMEGSELIQGLTFKVLGLKFNSMSIYNHVWSLYGQEKEQMLSCYKVEIQRWIEVYFDEMRAFLKESFSNLSFFCDQSFSQNIHLRWSHEAQLAQVWLDSSPNKFDSKDITMKRQNSKRKKKKKKRRYAALDFFNLIVCMKFVESFVAKQSLWRRQSLKQGRIFDKHRFFYMQRQKDQDKLSLRQRHKQRNQSSLIGQ